MHSPKRITVAGYSTTAVVQEPSLALQYISVLFLPSEVSVNVEKYSVAKLFTSVSVAKIPCAANGASTSRNGSEVLKLVSLIFHRTVLIVLQMKVAFGDCLVVL